MKTKVAQPVIRLVKIGDVEYSFTVRKIGGGGSYVASAHTPIENTQLESEPMRLESQALQDLKTKFKKQLDREAERRVELQKLERWNKGLPR